MVLELGGDLQVLWVGEGVLEGGLVHLAVYYWGRGWGVFFVGDFGRVGFLGCFGEGEGPVFEVVGGFLHGSGLDDGADFVQHGFEARQLAGPETIEAPTLIGGEEFSSRSYVLGEVGSVLEAEDEGGDEVHGACKAELEHFDGFLFDCSGLQKW